MLGPNKEYMRVHYTCNSHIIFVLYQIKILQISLLLKNRDKEWTKQYHLLTRSYLVYAFYPI